MRSSIMSAARFIYCVVVDVKEKKQIEIDGVYIYVNIFDDVCECLQQSRALSRISLMHLRHTERAALVVKSYHG